MKEFRNIRERNKAQGEIEKKVGILFGMYNTNILWRYFEYMSGRYNEEISKFSNTSIEFEDIRNIIDKTLFLKSPNNMLYIFQIPKLCIQGLEYFFFYIFGDNIFHDNIFFD